MSRVVLCHGGPFRVDQRSDFSYFFHERNVELKGFLNFPHVARRVLIKIFIQPTTLAVSTYTV